MTTNKKVGWQAVLATTSVNPLLLILTVIALFSVYVWQKRRHLHELASKIPGPKPLPIIGNILEFKNVKNTDFANVLAELVAKYGGTTRLWLGSNLFILISKPEDIELCLNSTKLLDKNEMYSFIADALGNGLLNSGGEVWRKHRRIITPTFHMSILKQFVEIFDRQTMNLVKRLEKTMHRNFNVFPFIRDCTFDFISETALEATLNSQSEASLEVTDAVEKIVGIIYERMYKIWLHPNWIFHRTELGKEYVRLRNFLRNSTSILVNNIKEDISKKIAQGKGEIENRQKSFVRLLVELNEKGETFSDQELKDEIATIVATGYETSAAAIAFVLVMLGIHQDVQERVYEEIKTIEERVNGKPLIYEDLQDFEYTDRVIKETLRLWPVGPVILRNASEDVQLASCTVPKGASVGVVFMRSHRDPATWTNPNDFNPDNFLPENVEKRHPYSYTPFSAGPRNCIGKRYAEIAVRVMLYHIVRHYHIYSDQKMSDVGALAEISLKMDGGYIIRLEPRN